jgi:TatD DNase family protein
VLLVDTHCHLNLNLYENDLDEVLERAWEQGLVRIMIPGVDLETSQSAVTLSERYPNLYAAIGIHPNDALHWNVQTLPELNELALHAKVFAIGEIGLDFYRDKAPRLFQLEVFQKQLDLAACLQKPVIVHSRNAMHEIWPTLKSWQENLIHSKNPLATTPGVLHSFEGSLEIAQEAIAHHFLIGVNGIITFQNAIQRQQITAKVPLENIVLETDAPFLTPHPFRGQRNEPALIMKVAQKLADLFSKSLPDVVDITAHNSDRLFAWGAFA